MTLSLDSVGTVAAVLFAVLVVSAFVVLERVGRRRGFFDKKPRAYAGNGPLAYAATSRGWSYRPSASPLLLGVTAPPFGLGDSQRIFDVIVGSRPAGPFLAFRLELAYRAKNQSEDVLRSWRIASIPLPGVTPRLALTPDGALAALFGAGVLERGELDVDVESHAFNKRWRAGADDHDYAHAVLTPAVIALLLDAPRELTCITIEDGHLLAASGVPVLDVGWIETALNTLEDVRAGIPPFVWKRWAIRRDPAAPRAWSP